MSLLFFFISQWKKLVELLLLLVASHQGGKVGKVQVHFQFNTSLPKKDLQSVRGLNMRISAQKHAHSTAVIKCYHDNDSVVEICEGVTVRVATKKKNLLLWFADNSRRFSKRGVMKGDLKPVFLEVAWKSLSSIFRFCAMPCALTQRPHYIRSHIKLKLLPAAPLFTMSHQSGLKHKHQRICVSSQNQTRDLLLVRQMWKALHY